MRAKRRNVHNVSVPKRSSPHHPTSSTSGEEEQVNGATAPKSPPSLGGDFKSLPLYERGRLEGVFAAPKRQRRESIVAHGTAMGKTP